MKKIFLVVLVAAMLAATTAMATEGMKIGYIDLQRACGIRCRQKGKG